MATLFHIKKRTLFLLIICILFLSGCALFHFNSPFDYPDSIWICEDPYVYLHVIDEHEYNAECYVIINGERVEAGFYTNGAIGSIIKTNRSESINDIIYHFEYKCNEKTIQLKMKEGYNDPYTVIVLKRIK